MFTKTEIHTALQAATKFHNEHVSLPFTAGEIPDAVHEVISSAYAKLLDTSTTTTYAFGFALRDFANANVPLVIEALIEPSVDEVIAPVVDEPVVLVEVIEPVVEEPVVPVVKPTKKSKVVEAAPVVDEPAIEPTVIEVE